MNDRRKPLGGIDKETYVHSFKDARLNAEFTYDLIAGLRSDLCFKVDGIKEDVAEIKNQCSCRLDRCSNEFVSKMKIKDKFLPISKATFYFGCATILILIGAGIVGPSEIIKWAKTLIMFV